VADHHLTSTDIVNEDALVPVVQYIRMSTEHQKYSPENQAIAIAEYAKSHGMRIVKTYVDSGKSGLNLKGRPGLQALLRDVQHPSPGFQFILIYDISRWGRFPDPDEAAAHAHTCKSHGIKLIYCAEPFNNDGSLAATVMTGVKRSMVAEYSRELGVKVFAGACTLVRYGFRQGGMPGYGLRRQLIDEQRNVKGLLSHGQRKSIQTDRVILVPGPPDEIATVQRIYQLFIHSSMPERVIAATLNRDGILSDMGRPWTRGTIHQILTNEKYIGNNLYNRTSSKLKTKQIRNAPEEWVRSDGVFEGIVPVPLFSQAQAIIAARSRHLDNAQMLDLLRQTLARHGALSGMIIDEDDDSPSSSSYSHRFGSLLRAYSLIGYTPQRDYAYLEINRELRRRHPELINEMTTRIVQLGGWVVRDDTTDLITINGEFTTSLVIARCKETSTGSYRWIIRFDTGLAPDITIVIRMDPSNQKAFDYYVLPSIDFSAAMLPTHEDNGFTLDAYRTDSLEHFYHLAGRVPFKEAV